MKYVFVTNEGNRGMGEECECGLEAKWLDRGIGGTEGPDRNFGVVEMSKCGVVKEVCGDSVDCDECWRVWGCEL